MDSLRPPGYHHPRSVLHVHRQIPCMCVSLQALDDGAAEKMVSFGA